MSDTIFSLSSGHGRAGVAVIRISGALSDHVLESLSVRLPEYRCSSLVTFKHPETGEPLDQGLVLRFAQGHSFTGDPSCELQIHGGRAVVQSLLRALAGIPGLRQALPGEFTRRALENGRLDLTQVEALADLIDSETDEQRRQALRGFEGVLGREILSWRHDLREIRGMIAAEIDFSDEGDVGEDVTAEIDSHLERLEKKLRHALASALSGRIIAEGYRVALIGPPNAGKSSLLNALAGSDIAIVTEHAGTTRDVLEVRLDIEGYPVVLFDTAGLRESHDPVESIGIERAQFAAARADVLLIMEETSGSLFQVPDSLKDVDSIRIRSKSDLVVTEAIQPVGALHLSALTGEGLPVLKDVLLDRMKQSTSSAESLVLTRTRHIEAVSRALEHCVEARRVRSFGIEFLDNEVRSVDLALQQLLGSIGVEEILGEVFSRFCVGK